MGQLVFSLITSVSILGVGALSTPRNSAKDMKVNVSITGELESLWTIVTNLQKELKGIESFDSKFNFKNLNNSRTYYCGKRN